MPLINLIEEQRLGSRQDDRRARLFLFGLVGAFVVIGGAFGWLMLETDTLSGKEAKLLKQVNEAAPIMAEIESNKKQLLEMSPKLTTLEGAQESTLRWSRILDHVSHNTPDKTYLTSIRCVNTDPTKPVQLTVVGISANQEAVGDFMTRLHLCDDLEAVNLKFTQEKIVERAKAIEFEINADVVGTAESKPKDEEKPEANKA